MKRLLPKFKYILEIFDCGDGLLIREQPNGFGERNLYKVDYSLNPIWEAELPHDQDAYLNNLNVEDGVIKTNSGDCFYCEIDLKTGKILKKHWTK